MNIIGLTGKAGAGKDAVADVLVKEHGWVRVALADPMKRFCREMFGFTDEQLWGPSEKRNEVDRRFPRAHTTPEGCGCCPCICCGVGEPKTGVPEGVPCFLTPRHALQQLGTEWGRAMSEDVWINKALEDAKEIAKLEGTLRCYTPQRGIHNKNMKGYPDERDLLHVRGVVIPDVRFPNERNRIRAEGGRIWHKSGIGSLEGAAASHESESHKLAFDVEIPWLDDVAQLPDIVKRLLEAK